MDKDTVFNKVGKRMPYRIPEGFFDAAENDLYSALFEKKPVRKKNRRFYLWSIAGTVAAACVIVTILLNAPAPSHEDLTDWEHLEQAFFSLEESEQNALMASYQNDIFMNEELYLTPTYDYE